MRLFILAIALVALNVPAASESAPAVPTPAPPAEAPPDGVAGDPSDDASSEREDAPEPTEETVPEATGDAVRLQLGETDKPGIWGPMGNRFYFDDGLRYENGRWDLRMALVGRFHLDGLSASQDQDVEDAVGAIEDGFFIRRLRLDLRGHWREHIDFQAQYDIKDEDVTWRKVYVDLVDFRAFDRLRIGYFPEPIGLEQIMSSNHSTFLERGLPFAFSPQSNAGIAMHNALSNIRMLYEIGAFNEVESYSSRPEGTWGGTARLAGVPWMYRDADGVVHLDRFLHLGVAASVRAPKDGVAYSTRPEIGRGPDYVGTATLESDEVRLLGAEAAYVSGPLSIQGEWMRAIVDRETTGETEDYDAYYAYASYILTGESRPYNRRHGVFRGVVPSRPFPGKGGIGAWEVAARLSAIDLTGGVPVKSAGELRDLTLGLNWYMNPHARAMLNYVRAKVERPDVTGYTDIVQMRFQLTY